MHTPRPLPVVSHRYSPSPRLRRRLQLLASAVLGTALLGAAALQLAADPPGEPMPAGTLRGAGQTLKHGQAQILRGLQVSMRAVADGHEVPSPAASVQAAAPAARQERR